MIGRASSARPGSGWAACVAVALVVALAIVASPSGAQAEAKPIKIAHQTDRDSGRLVLEFARPVEYAIERAGADIFIRFSQPIGGDLDAAQRALARYIAEMRLAGAGRVLIMRIVGQPRMTHYRRGNAVVIVWVGGGRPEPAVAVKPPETKPAEAKPPENKPAEAKPAEPAPKMPEPKAAEKPAAPPAKAPEPKAMEKPASPPAQRAEPKSAERPTPPAAAKPDKPPETKRADAAPPKSGPNGSPDAAAPPAVGPALAVSNNGTETRIALAWPEPTGAAVFRYGDTVWMVFSRRQAFDVAPHQKRLGPGVERLTRLEHAEATVLAARIRPGMAARVTRERNVWTVALRRDSAPATENELKIAITHGANEQVTVALAGAETPIRLADPDSGSTLVVVPSRALAAAAGERRFVTFRLLPAMQGAVVESLADGITVGAEGAAIVIRRNGGLLISGGPAPGLPPQGQ